MINVEALLRDEVLADHVWELWNAGLIPDEVAGLAWSKIALEYRFVMHKGD